MKPSMELFLKLTIDKVAKNVTVVTKEELGQDFMLHISPVKMNNKPYIPWIGRRQANMEDRTIPRITVAPTLYGCYIGYGQLILQCINYNPANHGDYKQGLYIHEIEFDESLKPNNKLVYDASRSDEHWLVTYDEETKVYKGKVIGKLFITEIKTKPISGKEIVVAATIYVEVNKLEGIRFSKNIFLSKGYHVIENISEVHQCAWDKDKEITVKEISSSDYESAKRQSAAMLSLTVNKPPFTKW